MLACSLAWMGQYRRLLAPGGGVLALPRRQHEIFTYIAAAEFRRWLYDAATAKEKQRVASASAAKASLWLTSFPTMPDDDFVIGVKHRLGMPSWMTSRPSASVVLR